jgi:hypothetical protein
VLGFAAVRLFALYVAAAVVYVGVGLVEPAIYLHWLVALPFVLAFVWGLPALARRLR